VSRKPMADVTRELNFAVQRTIDRLIFLRICEDRGIEHYAFLQSLVNGVRSCGGAAACRRRFLGASIHADATSLTAA
jgi:hypothetical protein